MPLRIRTRGSASLRLTALSALIQVDLEILEITQADIETARLLDKRRSS